MRQSRLAIWLILNITCFVATLVECRSAQAGLMYTIEFTNTVADFNQSSQWSTDVVLKEYYQTAADVNVAILNKDNGVGIVLAGFNVTVIDSGTSVITGGSPSSNPDFLGSGGSQSFNVIDGTNAYTSSFVGGAAGVFGDGAYAGVPGSFSLNLGSLVGNFGVGDNRLQLNDPTNTILDSNGNFLIIANSPTLTLSGAAAVPEPSSIALVAIVGMGFAGRLGWRWRKHKQNSV